MDITACKEIWKRGETVNFPLSKKKMFWWPILFIGMAVFGAGMALFSKGDTKMLLFGIFAFVFSGVLAVLMGKCLFSSRLPQVLSINKEVLTIYDLPISALLGGKNPSVLIPLHEIVDMDAKTIRIRNSQDSYLMLQCLPSTLQNIKQHEKQVSGKLLKIYEVIKEDTITLNGASLIDIPLADLLALLKDLHKEISSAN